MLVVQATNAYVHRPSGYQAEGGGRKAVGRVIDQPNQGVTLTTNFHILKTMKICQESTNNMIVKVCNYKNFTRKCYQQFV